MYTHTDLYVSTSLTDGSSVTLLEAMACNLPVLVSDIPGNQQWVDGGVNGFLFPPKHTACLREQILKCSRLSKEVLQTLGMEGRKKVEQKGCWKKNRKQILMSYECVLTKSQNYRFPSA